jgi:hypothetical protein
VSIATDLSVHRNFKKEQLYWAFGHNTQAIFHFTPTDGIYVGFAYFSNGKFKNKVTATAKSLLTNPQQVTYINSAKMQLKQFAIGWRKYLKGSADGEKSWNLYAQAGFGVLFGRVENIHSVSVDSAVYAMPVLNGTASFKRLTLDLGLGWEIPISGDFYLYTEAKVWVPTTDYPSSYIFVNNNAPLVGMLGIGFRIIF